MATVFILAKGEGTKAWAEARKRTRPLKAERRAMVLVSRERKEGGEGRREGGRGDGNELVKATAGRAWHVSHFLHWQAVEERPETKSGKERWQGGFNEEEQHACCSLLCGVGPREVIR